MIKNNQNQNSLRNSKNPSWYYLYSILQILASILLVITTVLYYYYNHSGFTNIFFMILVMGSYVGIIAIHTFYYGISGLIYMFKKKSIDLLKRFKFEKKYMYSTKMAIFHLTLSVAIILVFFFMTVFDYYQSVSLFNTVITFLAIMMAGYAILLIISSVNFLKQKIILLKNKKKGTNKQEKPKILPGMIVFSILALFSIPAYFGAYFINNPQFTPGLTRKIDLFIGGTDGYKNYRIPSILVIPQGYILKNGEWVEQDIILAFAEGRKFSALDTGTIDIVMKRSVDGGTKWSEMKILVTHGNDLARVKYGNQMCVFDEITGVVFLIFLKKAPHIPAETYIIQSDDGGISWSVPRLLDVNLPSSGHGIQLKWGNHQGRLIFTSYKGTSGDSSSVIYSDDHGLTWKDGNDVGDGDECQVVETIRGKLYMTMRKNAPLGTLNKDFRLYSWSFDGGIMWTEAREELELPTPICSASICRVTSVKENSKNRIIFANPSDHVNRARMTIRLSYDECQSWKISKLLYEGPSGYSDLAVKSDYTMICFFERGRQGYSDVISYVEFDLEWLTSGTDKL
ncbi:MAG: sialidase family protein [Promethearchaeota archaeon]